jgi:hypothetical protein
MLWTVYMGPETHERLPSQGTLRGVEIEVFMLTKPGVHRRVAGQREPRRTTIGCFRPIRGHSGTAKGYEFDRARLAPVRWTMPVLRAVFACPCVHAVFRVRGLPIVADQRLECGRAGCTLKARFTLSPCTANQLPRRSELTRSILYPAPPSAQTPGWLCSNGEPREQAHLPAEQPSAGQDPRLPSAYAHPRGPRHPGCPPRQGSLRTVRLRLDACCQRVIVCGAAPISARYFGGHAAQADLVQAAASSWFMPTRPTRARVSRRGSVLSSPGRWATRWFATAPNGSCAHS